MVLLRTHIHIYIQKYFLCLTSCASVCLALDLWGVEMSLLLYSLISFSPFLSSPLSSSTNPMLLSFLCMLVSFLLPLFLSLSAFASGSLAPSHTAVQDSCEGGQGSQYDSDSELNSYSMASLCLTLSSLPLPLSLTLTSNLVFHCRPRVAHPAAHLPD